MPVTIILPTKNEAQSIASTITAIRTICKDAEIVVADGWSTDNTQYIARYECNVPVVTDDIEGKGKGSGLRKAFKWVSPPLRRDDGIIFVDPDGSYPLYLLPEFIEHLKHNDVVIGERTHLAITSTVPAPLRSEAR